MTAPDLSARHRAAVDVATASQPSPPPRDRDSHEDLRARIDALEAVARSRDAKIDAAERHRTRVETILGLAGACAVVVVIGALNARDAITRLEASGTTREARIAALEAAGSRRDTDDRGTREALVRLQTTVAALESTIAHRLDAIDARLAAQSVTPHR